MYVELCGFADYFVCLAAMILRKVQSVALTVNLPYAVLYWPGGRRWREMPWHLQTIHDMLIYACFEDV
jgi:hypothetical protein